MFRRKVCKGDDIAAAPKKETAQYSLHRLGTNDVDEEIAAQACLLRDNLTKMEAMFDGAFREEQLDYFLDAKKITEVLHAIEILEEHNENIFKLDKHELASYKKGLLNTLSYIINKGGWA